MKGCYNDPNTELTDGDRKTIEEFKELLKDKEDQRNQCDCEGRCIWPKCLSEEQKKKLLDSIGPDGK